MPKVVWGTDDYAKVRQMAVQRARKIAPSHAEDIAQQTCLRYLEGGKAQPMRLAVIDAARDILGASRYGIHKFRKAEREYSSIDNLPATQALPDTPSPKLLSLLSGPERCAATLYYKWGFTLREIGDCLGVSESRASQILTQSLSTLGKAK